MMTGQILGGSDPATAARYQIIVMFLIGAATGLSSGAPPCPGGSVSLWPCSGVGWLQAGRAGALRRLSASPQPCPWYISSMRPYPGQPIPFIPLTPPFLFSSFPPFLLSFFAVATIFLAVLSLVDDKHRLRSERLVARESSAKGAVAWLASQAKQVGGRADGL